MDWYFSGESDDLIVPNGLETSDVLCEDDRSLLPNGWLQWGVTAPESFKSPNNTAIEPTSKFNLGNFLYIYIQGLPFTIMNSEALVTKSI